MTLAGLLRPRVLHCHLPLPALTVFFSKSGATLCLLPPAFPFANSLMPYHIPYSVGQTMLALSCKLQERILHRCIQLSGTGRLCECPWLYLPRTSFLCPVLSLRTVVQGTYTCGLSSGGFRTVFPSCETLSMDRRDDLALLECELVPAVTAMSLARTQHVLQLLS